MTGGRIRGDCLTLNPPPDWQGTGGDVNFIVVGSDPNGVYSGQVGDRATLIGAAGEWVCAGGTVWIPAGVAGTSRTLFTYQPGGTANEAQGVYTDWDDLYAAADAVRDANALITIVIDDTVTSPAVIPAGTYDLSKIQLAGICAFQAVDAPGMGAGPATVMRTGNTVFTNFTQGISFLALEHTGDAPLYTAPDGITTVARTGFNSAYYSTGGQSIFRTGASGELFIYVDPWTTVATGTNPVFESRDPASLSLYVTGRSSFAADVLEGNGDINLYMESSLAAIAADQSTHSGSLTTTRPEAENIGYSPGTPADWAATAPTQVKQALDRIASAVEGLLGAPIP